MENVFTMVYWSVANTLSLPGLEEVLSCFLPRSPNRPLRVTMVKETKLYDRLGVDPDAGETEIKRAFRKGAMQYHPDKNPAPEAQVKFKEMSEAYEILSDSEKRRMYDRSVSRPVLYLLE